MAIELDPNARQHSLAAIKRFVLEELEQDIGDLKAGAVLEFFLAEIAPRIYNRAIADAQQYMQERALDLEGACHAEGAGYWAARAPSPRRGR